MLLCKHNYTTPSMDYLPATAQPVMCYFLPDIKGLISETKKGFIFNQMSHSSEASTKLYIVTVTVYYSACLNQRQFRPCVNVSFWWSSAGSQQRVIYARVCYHLGGLYIRQLICTKTYRNLIHLFSS